MSKILEVVGNIEKQINDLQKIDEDKINKSDVEKACNFDYVYKYNIDSNYTFEESNYTDGLAGKVDYDCKISDIGLRGTGKMKKFEESEGGKKVIEIATTAENTYNSIKQQAKEQLLTDITDIYNLLSKVSTDITDLKVEKDEVKKNIADTVEKLKTIKSIIEN